MRNIIKKLLRENLNQALISEITSDEAWEKIYSNIKNFPYLKGNKQIFDKIDTLYPKRGNQFNKGYFGFLYNLLKNNELKDEDSYKAKQYLELFDKNFGKLPKEKRNITQFKNLPDLYDAVSGFERNTDEPESKNQELKTIREKEIERVYEDEEWKVLIPKTERASCLVGKGTQWCTAADRGNNMFDQYNKKGNLYVLIKKEDDSKYQIHFEDKQLMDSRDRPVSGAYFFENVLEDNKLVDWFEQNIPEFYDFILETSAEDIASGGYYELFDEALREGSEEAVREALNVLRNGEDEDKVTDGFLLEKDPYFIKDDQVSNYIESFNSSEMFTTVIEHLKDIGYDLDEVQDENVKKTIKALNDLKKNKLGLGNSYKIDKKRNLKIVSIDTEKEYPRYKIKIENTEGLVPIDTLLSYLNNRTLFERQLRKKLLEKNILMEVLNSSEKITCEKCGWDWKKSESGPDMYFCHKCGHDNTPDNINESESRIQFNIEIPSDILAIKDVFKKNGYKLYVVGGAVRDALLNKQPKDFDLATDAVPDKVEEILNDAGFRTLPTGKAFGVINVFTDSGEYEIATFRSDKYKGDDLEGFKDYLKSLNNGSYEKFLSKLTK